MRKQQVIASFVEHFEENHEHLVSGCFQFYIFKLSHKKCFMLYLLETIYRTQDTREATIYFFCRVFWRKAMETLKASFFSLISLNIITKDILDFLTATVVFMYFIDHFKEIMKIRHMSTFSFIVVNYVQRSAMYFLSTLQC